MYTNSYILVGTNKLGRHVPDLPHFSFISSAAVIPPIFTLSLLPFHDRKINANKTTYTRSKIFEHYCMISNCLAHI